MDYVRICDRTDDLVAHAILFVEQRLEIDHIGTSIGLDLGVHAMIGRNADNGSQFDHFTDFGIHSLVKVKRLGCVGCKLVLHVIGERQVEKIGQLAFDQFGTS